jgi:Flp pilus assembly protein TadG
MLTRRHRPFLPTELQRRLVRLYHDQRGVVVLLVALGLPALIGAMGVAAESSYWYMHQRAAQNAADAAAIAAATAGTVNGSSAWQPEAKAVATRLGFTDGSGNITVTATHPGTATDCTSGCYTVTVQDKVPLFLSKVVGYGGTNNSGLTTLSASAVATVWGGSYCILALRGDVTQDFTTNGAPKANLAGCDIMANSSAVCHGSNLGSPIGDAHGTNSGCGIVQNSNVPTLDDPFSGLASNIPADTCGGSYPQEPTKKNGTPLPASNQLSGNLIWSGNVIKCGDVQLTGDTTINAPDNAVLVIENGMLDTNGHTLKTASGSGLTIVFTGDTTNATYQHYPTGAGTLDIAAPTSGPWSGMAIYQDPNLVNSGNPGNLDVSAAGNSPAWDISGMVYLPKSNVTLSGIVNKAGTGSSCFGMTIGTLTINGTGQIFANPGDTAQCQAAGLTLPHHRGTLVN